MPEILVCSIEILLNIYWWIILIRVLLSWLPMAGVRIDPYNPIIRFLYSATDPVLEPIRRYTTVSMMDFSPIVVLLGIGFLITLLPC